MELYLKLLAKESRDDERIDAASVPVSLKMMVDMFELVTNTVLTSAGAELSQSIAITIQSTPITPAGLEAFVALCKGVHEVDRAAVQRVAVQHRALTVQLVALMDFFQLKTAYRHALNFLDFGTTFMLCSNDFFLRIAIEPVMGASDGSDDLFVGPDTSISFEVHVDSGLYRNVIVKFRGLVAPDDDDDDVSKYYRRDRSIDMSSDVFFEFSQHLCTVTMDIVRFTVQANNPGKKLYSRMMQFVVQNRRILFFTTNAKVFLDLIPEYNDYARMFIERTLNYPAILAPTVAAGNIESSNATLHARVSSVVFEPESPDDGKPLVKFFLEHQQVDEADEL